jgi:hypothetical protein
MEGKSMKIIVRFYSELLGKECERAFDGYTQAFAFAAKVGGYVVG